MNSHANIEKFATLREIAYESLELNSLVDEINL
jgi:hypothetical protein